MPGCQGGRRGRCGRPVTDFQGTTVEASGKTVEIDQKAIEVLRRQPDGTWRLIVGDSNGRRR